MERDSIIAHGAAFLLHERLMNSSDRHPAVICDKCGSKLFKRDDDNEETVANRLNVYHSQTEPLIEYYQKKGVLHTVIGQEKFEDTVNLVKNVLKD